MEKEFIFASLVTVIFALMKFIEMRYIDKETLPLKYFVRDAIKIFIASFIGFFIFSKLNSPITDFINTITNTPSLDTTTPIIFTDEPGF